MWCRFAFTQRYSCWFDAWAFFSPFRLLGGTALSLEIGHRNYIGEFIFESVHKKGVQMASENEIIAMKLDIVLRGGRFFFWDLHYFLDKVTIDEMIFFYEQCYPCADCSTIKSQFVNF